MNGNSLSNRIHKLEVDVSYCVVMLQALCKVWGADVLTIKPLARGKAKTKRTYTPRSNQWTDEQEIRLMDMINDGHSYKKIGRELGRTDKACMCRASKIHNQGRPWL